MITWLSGKMADLLVGGGTVKEEDRDIYVYGMDVLLSTVLNVLSIQALGFLLGKPLETLLFQLFFVVLRSAAGGFHASTHFRCFLIMFFSFCAAAALLFLLPAPAMLWMTAATAAGSAGVIVWLAPAPHENRPVTDREVKKFRNLSLGLCAAELAAVAALFLAGAPKLSLACALGLLTSAGSVLAAHVASKGKGTARKAA